MIAAFLAWWRSLPSGGLAYPGLEAMHDAIERVRLPGGWRRKRGVRYHDHLGLKGQRVPFTCPVIADIMRLLNGTEMDAGVRQSVLGRLELLRAYNAQLRRNEGGR